MKPPPRLPWLNLLAPLSFAAAAAACAARAGPELSAETVYLGLVATAVLVPLAFLARPGAPVPALAAVAAATIFWAVPGGEARGSAVVAVMALAVAWTLAVRLAEAPAVLGLETALPAALALQALLLSERLVEPGLRLEALAVLVALPCVAAWAVVVLARERGRSAALLAAGLLLAWSPGFQMAGVLALAALALASSSAPRGSRGGTAWPGLGLVLAVAILWEARFALVLALAAALSLWWESASTRLRLLLCAAIVTPILLPAPGRDLLAAAGDLAWLALLLPAILWSDRSRAGRVAVLLLFSLAAVRFAPAGIGLVAPLALLAFEVPSATPAARLQRFWTGALLAAVTLLAAYPWVRAFPLRDVVALAGLSPGWPPALALLAVFAALAGLAALVARRGGALPSLPVALGCLLLAGAASLPRDARIVVSHPLVLGADPAGSVFELDPPAPVSGVVIDTYLAGAGGLDFGTEVATVEIEAADGSSRTWPLRAGVETGEWAVSRADLRRRGVRAPRPWLSWIEPGGRFLAHRYRARRELETPVAASRVRLRRAAELPEGTSVAVFHLELAN